MTPRSHTASGGGAPRDDGYDLAIFDFDGTLADSIPWVMSIVDDLAAAHGLNHVDAEDLRALRSLNIAQAAKQFGVPAWRIPPIAVDVRRRMAAEIERIPLYEGIPALLRSLGDAGIALAVVSSNAEANVRTALGEDLAGLFAVYLCGVSLLGKASKLRQVVARTGIATEKAIYIGDEIRDVEAAHDAGMAVGAATWGYNDASSLAGADPTYLFRSVGEIAEAVVGRLEI